MSRYRIDFVDHANRVFRIDHFEAEHDEHARSVARQCYRSGIGKGYEIWNGDRRVHIENY